MNNLLCTNDTFALRATIWLAFAVGKIVVTLTFAANFFDMGNKHANKDKSSVEQPLESQVDTQVDTQAPFVEDTASDEIDKLKSELEEKKEKYIRLVAEFDNYRKRNSKEKIELIQTAGKEVITSLLDVLDDSDRASQQLNSSNEVEQIRSGVSLVFSKLKTTLLAKGLRPMESIGEDFNPDIHEAVAEIETDEKMKGKIIDEVQKGYYLNDKIIRFAKVIVGK